ncbi:MAG: DUF3502 domain-containing protein [Clostridiaceae bacterium]|nr:DUF3502 domain-containing protein [Clostridiaceae bacterium]
MSKNVRSLSLALVIIMVAGMCFTACSSNAPAATNTQATQITAPSTTAEAEPTATELPAVSLRVESLQFSNPGADNAAVEEQFKSIVKEKLNADLTINYTPLADVASKYPLLLSSGEKIDLMTTATIYSTEVVKGAFLDITDLFAKYCPNLAKVDSKINILPCTIDGKQYAVPNTPMATTPYMWIIRGDLRKKYNCPKVTDIDTLSQYLKAIKDNEPEMIPYDSYNSDISLLYHFMLNDGWKEMCNNPYLSVKTTGDGAGEIKYTYQTEYFQKAVKKAMEWYAAGYIPKNAYENKTAPTVSFEAGKSAMAYYRGKMDFNSLKTSLPGAEFEYLLWSEKNWWKTQGAWYAVPKSAANPERALMLLDLLYSNKDVYQLLQYGILNQDYKLDSEGKLADFPEANGKFVTLPIMTASFNLAFDIAPASADPVLYKLNRSENSKMITAYVTDGMAMDYSSVNAENNACVEVANTYWPLVRTGAIADYDKFITEYSGKLAAAGADKVLAEAKKQLEAHIQKVKALE